MGPPGISLPLVLSPLPGKCFLGLHSNGTSSRKNFLSPPQELVSLCSGSESLGVYPKITPLWCVMVNPLAPVGCELPKRRVRSDWLCLTRSAQRRA